MIKRKKWMLLVLPPVLILVAYLFRELLWHLADLTNGIYLCPFHAVTGLYCPGCGGTRSMIALLHGHLGEALHDNPASPALVLVLVLWYLEILTAAFGKKVRMIPRPLWFWGILVGVHLVWAVTRNFIPAMLPLS